MTRLRLKEILITGDLFVWLFGSFFALVLLMLFGLFTVVAVNGLEHFWPKRIAELLLEDQTKILGQISERIENESGTEELQVKRGNRDVFASDFLWVDARSVESVSWPKNVFALERREWGVFFGIPAKLTFDGSVVAASPQAIESRLPSYIERLRAITEQANKVHETQLRPLFDRQQRLLVQVASLKRNGVLSSSALAALRAEIVAITQQYSQIQRRLERKKKEFTAVLKLRDSAGTLHQVPVQDIVRFYPANALTFPERVSLSFERLLEFLSAPPREANTEGGVFPAIFGTVLMVFVMTIAVTPFGILTGIYLKEYARQGFIVSLVRIAVNNLAGVPSIVFGVFGLGFFIYFVGASIDEFFFSEWLPAPTFGTGGVLWASLTLALLTVPTVIVATEEGLAAIPRNIREASYALGATKFETMHRVVLPALLPAALTGVILAISRAAGEVAPLMLTGVVKLAPSLPVDSSWPYLHLDRKFMHLGFHIYDLGFQSPNAEAARSTVFATTLLLLAIVTLANITAILLRNRIGRKFRFSGV